MPELSDLLDATSAALRPTTTPAYDAAVLPRARRRRRRRTALLSGATALLLATVATAVVLSSGEPDRLEPPVVAEQPEVPAGSVEEPRPFTVPTTPATDPLEIVTPSDLATLAEPARSVPWELIRIWDNERRLAIRFSPGCSGRTAVLVRETSDHVVVQAVALDGDSVTTCLRIVRTAIYLDAPLGDRPLLHVPVDYAGPLRPLSFYVRDLPPYPGQSWYRDGRKVPATEVSLHAGPEHCGWQDAAFLGGSALTKPGEGPVAWVRDPDGVLDRPEVQQAFQAKATLPADATSTGYHLFAVELWTAPSDDGEFVYLVNGHDRDDVERWVGVSAVCR